MKKILSFVVGALMGMVLGACCSTSLPKSVDGYSHVYDSFYTQAVKVQARSIGGKPAIVGSGFPIDEERIMTAGHFCLAAWEGSMRGALKDEVDIVFVNRNDETAVWSGGEIEAIDERKDLCIVRRPGHGVPPPLLAKPYKVKTNDRVFIVGGPLGIFPVTSEGRVVRPKSKGFPVVDLNNRLLIAAAGTHGNSGGPVFNEYGEIIGVVMAKTSPYDHILFCVTIEEIKEFLKENG